MEIANVEIKRRTALTWKVAGTEETGTTKVSVFIDGNLRHEETVDNGVEREMNIDVRPVDIGLHTFLIVATTMIENGRSAHSSHATAQFFYDQPSPPALKIMSPSNGQKITKANFRGLVFDSTEIPHDAVSKGWFVDLELDNEEFKIPFFEGLINMEGLARGEHTATMGVFDVDSVYLGGREAVTFEIV